MNDNNAIMTGADRILTECLQLIEDERLVIVYDETTHDSVALLKQAADLRGIPCSTHIVPLIEQRSYLPDIGIPIDLGSLLDQARAVLTCLSGDEHCMPFRRDVLSRATSGSHKRVGHMPGMETGILAQAMDVDYCAIEQKCDELALALTIGEMAHLLTYSPGEEPAELIVGLGAWNRLGVVSPGRIPFGKWGNLPGGESFIAPVEGTARGTFWLNGSFKGYVIPLGQGVLLTFAEGRLVKVVGYPETRARFENLLAHAQDAGDPNWNVLAELGIGVNPGLTELTGRPLIDEKCLGTVHIAIGENMNFGGRSRSSIHEDLVTVAPSMWIDGKKILVQGGYAFQDAEWRENIELWPVDPALTDVSGLRVARGLITAKVHAQSLRVECSISERLCSYTIGDRATSPVLASIYSRVPVEGHERYLELWTRVHQSFPAMTEQVFEKAVAILIRHRVIVVFPSSERQFE